VSGNWPRLKALLEKFKDGSLPPDAWKTQIQINAADEFDADPGAYAYVVESDDEESKVPDVPKPQVALKISTVDLTGPSSTESTLAKCKLFSGSKPKALTDFHLRPSVYSPSMTDTLDPTTAKQLSATKARESLMQPVLSWRHRGILMKFTPGTANAVIQSFGFPDYAPNLAKDAFKELMDTRPWDVMFEDRSKFLILHVWDNLKAIARESLDAIVVFMSVHRRAIWWFGHWMFIVLETDDPYSEELHRERKAECDKDKTEYKKLLDDRVDASLEETILDEPGSWTIPAKYCHWILMHESQVQDDGTRYTLNEQMELLDDQEPVRVQWNTCASDEDRIKHLPEKYPLKLLKGLQRSSQKNRVTMDFD
ncbi:hypothetical protein PHMEG_00032209, partial [Phytophthora megakarya]